MLWSEVIEEIGEEKPAIPLDQPEFKPSASQLEQIIPLDQSDSHLQINPTALGHEEREIKFEESNEDVQGVSDMPTEETVESGEESEVRPGETELATQNSSLDRSDSQPGPNQPNMWGRKRVPGTLESGVETGESEESEEESDLEEYTTSESECQPGPSQLES